MELVDEVPLAIFTMVVGAILGAVIAPIGEALMEVLLERKRKRRIFHVAFLLFFAANGVWIIGEIFVEMFVRTGGRVGWPTAIAIAFIFGLAAITFAIGFRFLPKFDGDPTTQGIAGALKFLIIGNIFWITGEIIETFAWELWPEQSIHYNYGPTTLHLLFLLVALVVFVVGAVAAWRAAS